MLKYRKIYYAFSTLLILASTASLLVFGLTLGIDFKGGSIMEVKFQDARPSHVAVKEALGELELGEIIIQDSGRNNLILRFRQVEESVHQDIFNKINTLVAGEALDSASESEIKKAQEERFQSIGPVIGEETKNKAFWAIALVVVMILFYISWAFRKISFPLTSWVYGVAALIALFHDVLITLGIFSFLGYFLNLEIGVPFIAALLTILGYSVNDTIVVFDRVRENVMKRAGDLDFGALIDRAVRQMYVRSLNTSLTTLFVLFAIFLIGGATIKYFILTLIIGISVGTYSSIFLASPLLFSWYLVKFKK